MGNLSEHFSDSEFACRCGCGFNSISSELVVVLEDVRSHFNSPVTINSGCRCEKHNAKVGGVPNSQHVQGIAADIVVRGRTPALVADYLERKMASVGTAVLRTLMCALLQHAGAADVAVSS